MKNKEQISVVWLKRDLRLNDNEAIFNAISSKNRVLFVYIFEDSLQEDLHYSERHWNFIKQSLVDLNTNLKQYKTKVLTVQSEVLSFFRYALLKLNITEIFSHIETGILKTYERDKVVKRFCRNNTINWVENVHNGVFRGRENRDNWQEDWETYMNSKQFDFNPEPSVFISSQEIDELFKELTTVSLLTDNKTLFQKGGRNFALKYANSFFNTRYKNYAKYISKPTEARESCSRLSPYIAWGNVSIREIYQKAKQVKATATNKRAIDGFISRLRWQAHFIQKFEMECVMETESLNKGYKKLKKNISDSYIKAWEEGNTGIPFIDACMRCLVATGYLNFRMRAMLVSFLTHNLWQPWQEASKHLSRLFLDFEPGIHFPQLQMQAGETGINAIRIYSPIKNGLTHDSDALFITKWVPELKKLPLAFKHEPFKMTFLEQKLYDFELGDKYPNPIVDMKISRKKASDLIYGMRTDPEVINESYRILKKHIVRQ